jgi:outer membrane biosynthesis protein TonB
MRRSQRLIAAAVLIALSGDLAGCSSSLSNFDPSDLLDWLDTKKKLQGDRKPVFPEGVPGVEQGVPKSLYKGAQETNQNAPEPVPVPPPPAETKKKTAKKKQPAPTTASTDALTEEDTTAAAPQAPKKKIVRQRTTAPPPDQPADAQQPAQSGAQTQQSAFPAPLPGGTVTR